MNGYKVLRVPNGLSVYSEPAIVVSGRVKDEIVDKWSLILTELC